MIFRERPMPHGISQEGSAVKASLDERSEEIAKPREREREVDE